MYQEPTPRNKEVYKKNNKKEKDNYIIKESGALKEVVPNCNPLFFLFILYVMKETARMVS